MANNYWVEEDTIYVLRPLAIILLLIYPLIYHDYYHLIIVFVRSSIADLDMLTDMTGG